MVCSVSLSSPFVLICSNLVLNSIRPAILDFQPFSAFFNASDVARSRQILSVKPLDIPTKQFDIMKMMIEEGAVPQVEFAWVGC